jgi:hypothetical protein
VTGLKSAILIVLHQVVVGVPRERERIEPECVDDRFLEKPKARLRGLKTASIEGNDVVAKQELGRPRECVQRQQGVIEAAALVDASPLKPVADTSEALNSVSLWINLEIDRHASLLSFDRALVICLLTPNSRRPEPDVRRAFANSVDLSAFPGGFREAR